jgi:hypothetical protein
MKNFISLIFILIVVSCKNESQFSSSIFVAPKVLFVDTVKLEKTLFKSEYIEEPYAIFCGKYSLVDTVKFDKKKVFYRDSIFKKDGIYIEYDVKDEIDSTETSDFRVSTDYSQDVLFNWWATERANCYYPAFIQNTSKIVKTLIGKDDRVLAIQEAKDEKGIWRTIEYKGIDFCAVGYWRLNIYPKEYGVFLLRKYEGDFKTSLRVRIKVGKNICVSNGFEGSIDKKQFLLKVLNSETEPMWRESINSSFFGSIPLQLDTH